MKSFTDFFNEEASDGLKDRRMERGGVDGNNRYNKPLGKPNTFGKKKPQEGGPSAMEKVKAQIRSKYGDKAIKEDAKMGKQSDEKLAALHKQVSGADQSLPSNQFMLKRVSKEMNRRKGATKTEEVVAETKKACPKCSGKGCSHCGDTGFHTMKEEDVFLEKAGLWANMHAKRKRGEKPAKKGDKDYPKTLEVEGYAPGDVDQKVGAVTPIPKKDQNDARARILAKAKAKRSERMKSEAVLSERGDFWHPDPEKDKKLGGPGANQRAREDGASSSSSSSSSSNDKKLKAGESYMDYSKRQKAAKSGTATSRLNKMGANIKPKERKRDKIGKAIGNALDRVAGIKKEDVDVVSFKQFGDQ